MEAALRGFIERGFTFGEAAVPGFNEKCELVEDEIWVSWMVLCGKDSGAKMDLKGEIRRREGRMEVMLQNLSEPLDPRRRIGLQLVLVMKLVLQKAKGEVLETAAKLKLVLEKQYHRSASPWLAIAIARRIVGEEDDPKVMKMVESGASNRETLALLEMLQDKGNLKPGFPYFVVRAALRVANGKGDLGLIENALNDTGVDEQLTQWLLLAASRVQRDYGDEEARLAILEQMLADPVDHHSGTHHAQIWFREGEMAHDLKTLHDDGLLACKRFDKLLQRNEESIIQLEACLRNEKYEQTIALCEKMLAQEDTWSKTQHLQIVILQSDALARQGFIEKAFSVLSSILPMEECVEQAVSIRARCNLAILHESISGDSLSCVDELLVLWKICLQHEELHDILEDIGFNLTLLQLRMLRVQDAIHIWSTSRGFPAFNSTKDISDALNEVQLELVQHSNDEIRKLDAIILEKSLVFR